MNMIESTIKLSQQMRKMVMNLEILLNALFHLKQRSVTFDLSREFQCFVHLTKHNSDLIEAAFVNYQNVILIETWTN